MDVANKPLAFILRQDDDVVNGWCWGLEPRGNLSIKSTYESMIDVSSCNNSKLWSCI
ncbi:conserved hypothetical protein [Ricinus communis]|uniref:Uncharacterized protein n=1 Tax=Ricinus communis TaxID=3988 RepID=B9T833_RICCO|nr:conserved hypothetical protein [Ricinus communis]